MAVHPAKTQSPAVVLVVEDSHFEQRRLQRILRSGGVDLPVVVAGTIAKARAALEAHRVQYVLLDNALPDGVGVNFALEIAADPRLRSTPVALVTDWPTPFMLDKARMARVRAVMNKSEFRPDIARRLIA
jgi:CheY-like chemotaxis protein